MVGSRRCALAALAQREDVPDDWLTWAARNPVRPPVCEDRLLLRALAFIPGAGHRSRERSCRHVRQVSLETADDLEASSTASRAILGPDFRRSFPDMAGASERPEHRRIWAATVRRSATLLAGVGESSWRIRPCRARQSPPRSRPSRRRARRGEDRVDTCSARSDRRRRDRVSRRLLRRSNAGAITSESSKVGERRSSTRSQDNV